MITAKVVCNAKIDQPGDDRQVTVSFNADYADGRNKEWSLYTPSLGLTMALRGPVADRFEVGKAYTLEFREETPD